MAKPIITPEAEEDIDEILSYIASDDFGSSMAFYDRLSDLFETLAINPKAGRERPELAEGIRSFPLGSYVVLYRVWCGAVAIVRVFHSAIDLDELFS